MIFSFFAFLMGCSHNSVNMRRPAYDGSRMGKIACEQGLYEAKKQALDFLSREKKSSNFEVIRKVLDIQNSIRLECSIELNEKSNYKIEHSYNKILIDSALRNAEFLLESPAAKEQIEYLKIELRAITYDQLLAATILQAFYEAANGLDEKMSFYFGYLKANQLVKE